MVPKSVSLVLFDCDGTLVDSEHAIVEAMAAAFACVGLPAPSAAQVRAVIGLPLTESVCRLLPEEALSQADACTARYRAAVLALRQRPDHDEPLYPGIRAAIERIAAGGALLGIVTGKARRGLLATLERHGLRDCFTTLHTADDGPGKPAPDMVLDAMSRTGADPCATVVIGDTTFDIEMARNACVRSIGVAWGYHSPLVLKRVGADRIATMAMELPRLVAGLLQGTGDAPRL